MQKGNVLVGLLVTSLAMLAASFVLMMGDNYVVKPVKAAIYLTVHKLHPAAQEKLGIERNRLFSDYSKPGEWPSADAAEMRTGIEKGRDKLFGEIKRKTTWTPAELDSYGAQAWGMMAAAGPDAHNMIRDGNGQLLEGSGTAFVLIGPFLNKRCKEKRIPACLDATKITASALATWKVFDQEGQDRAALSNIPPWLTTPEANELRTRISSQGGFWRYVEKIVR